MAKCSRCGRSGLTLKVDGRGYCPDCVLKASQNDAERILQDARREAESESRRTLDAARSEADQLIADARAEADRLIAAAKAEHDRVLGGVEGDLEKAKRELARVRQNSAEAVGTAKAQLAALFLDAGKDFAFAAKVAAVREAPKRKYLTHAQFKKAAKQGYVVFDLETTGLYASTCRIIECGAIRYGGDGAELDRFHALINPGTPIPSASIAVHGITDSMVADAPTAADVLPAFIDFLGDAVCVAHNAPFDVGFVEAEAQRLGLDVSLQAFDTLPTCRKVYDLPNHRLGTVAQRLGYRSTGAHRSMADCEALNAIVRDLLAR